MKKKIISLLLVMTMVLSLAACGTNAKGSKENTAPGLSEDGKEADLADIIPDKTVELTIYSQLANYSGEQVGWFAKIMLDKFNVKVNIISEGDGTFSTRMAGGNLGDIVVFGSDGDEYLQAVEAGMLYDWEEDNLLEYYGPYINANMQKALEKNRNISGDKLYGFGHNVAPSAEDHEAFFYYPDIRWDLYAKLGYPEVNTLEDYIPILEQMVAIEPVSDTGGKTYGVSLFPDWDGDAVMFVKSTAALYGWDEFGFGLYHATTNEFQDYLQEGGMYLRCLKFYNTLFQKGLVDPDSMTQTSTDQGEKYRRGAAFFTLFSFMGRDNYNSDAHIAEGKAMYPLAAADAKNIVYGLNVYGGDRVWTIGSKTAYPELCMAIINWLSTPEGKMTTDNGPRGITWDYDSESNPYLTDLGKKIKSSGETEMPGEWGGGMYKDGVSAINNKTWADDSKNPDANGTKYNYLFWDSTLMEEASEIEQDWIDFAGALSPDEYLDENGHISVAVGTAYSPSPKSDELQATWKQVAKCIKDNSWKAIYAKTDAEYDAIVAEMIKKAKDYGYDICIEYQQGEAERRAALVAEAMK